MRATTGTKTDPIDPTLYWVEFDLRFMSESHDSISEWCMQQYGVMGPWFIAINRVYFYNRDDRTAFIMSWL